MAYAEEGSINQSDDIFLKKGCLDDAELPIDQSFLRASHSSSQSGQAQEEAPSDGEETSSRLKVEEKKPKPSDHGKIPHQDDEDGHSEEKPPSVVEDEQHSVKIGVHATEDYKQEPLGSARGHVQSLLDMDDETISEKTRYFFNRLNFESPERCAYGPEYDPEQLMELYEQLALYRIRAYELTVDRKLAELDDANLKLHYPPSKLYDKYFFEYYEESLEWYFDLERCKHAHFDNYQRLVLRGYPRYLDWDLYHFTLNTYEEDLAYVQYFEAVANATKWIEDYLGDSTIQWKRVEAVAEMQALEIAAGFPNVSPLIISYGFQDYIYKIVSGYSYKELDGLFFEIWKRVAKGKMNFREALLEIQGKDMFPLRSFEIKHELENTPGRFPLKDRYDAHVAGIDKMASDDKVRQLIRDAIIEMASRPKCYLDYARRKLDIILKPKYYLDYTRSIEFIS